MLPAFLLSLFDPDSASHPFLKIMFNFLHFGNKISFFNDSGIRTPAGYDKFYVFGF